MPMAQHYIAARSRCPHPGLLPASMPRHPSCSVRTPDVSSRRKMYSGASVCAPRAGRPVALSKLPAHAAMAHAPLQGLQGLNGRVIDDVFYPAYPALDPASLAAAHAHEPSQFRDPVVHMNAVPQLGGDLLPHGSTRGGPWVMEVRAGVCVCVLMLMSR